MAKIRNSTTPVNSVSRKINRNFENFKPNSGASLDTLAQLGTEPSLNLDGSTSYDNKKALKKRARRKYFTNGLVTGLVAASEKNHQSILQKGYWRTWHCNSALTLYDSGSITGKYCKRRWCMVCNAIRTAKGIIRYKPVIESWKDAQMVTLTQETVYAADLPNQLNIMHSVIKSIQEYCKKQHQRKKCSFKLVGIRKLECTFRPCSKKYHPHFHLIVQSKEMAEKIVSEWISRNTKAGIKVNRAAQDIRKADSNACVEIFKYMTKVVASTGKRTTRDGDRLIYADALDVIFNAMHGRRVLQPFGFKAPKALDVSEGESLHDIALTVLEWDQDGTDWYNKRTGEGLSGYVPGEGMKDLVQNKVVY